MKWWCFRPLLCTLLRLNWAKQAPGLMTKLAPEWVRTSDPVIRSPARYRWTKAPARVGGGGRVNIMRVGVGITIMHCHFTPCYITKYRGDLYCPPSPGLPMYHCVSVVAWTCHKPLLYCFIPCTLHSVDRWIRVLSLERNKFQLSSVLLMAEHFTCGVAHLS